MKGGFQGNAPAPPAAAALVPFPARRVSFHPNPARHRWHIPFRLRLARKSLRRRWLWAVAALALAAAPAGACTFCSGGLQSRLTLRGHQAQAAVVVYGKLKNPRFDPATDAGRTDLQVEAALKADAALPPTLTVPRYLPVVGDTPPDFLLFGTVRGTTIEPTHGLPATAAVVAYLKAAFALDDRDAAKRLGFFFQHLDSADAAVAEDAFAELARASDAEILAAAKGFDAGKLRVLITAPATPAERLGVFAFVLGVCGGPADAAFLADIVTQRPLPERTASALGGLLAGYILLAPKEGWAVARAALGDARRPFAERLSVIGTVRFFQMTRPAESRADVLRCCGLLLPQGDLADQAVEDLRRWGWWDLTADVLAQWPKPTHAAPIVRRTVVRYALSCPRPEAKAFVAAARQSDARLVASVEESLALYEQGPPARR